MDRVVTWQPAERADLLREAAALKGMVPEIVEKDLWVCWVLDRLFADPGLAKKLLFKGGTSLSKVFGLIERFSEDIDLILNWNEVASADPLAERSNTRQDAFNKQLIADTRRYLAEVLLPEVRRLIGDPCQVDIGDHPDIISIRYPAAFASEYLRPQIQLEIGCLAAWVPNAEYRIQPYVAEALPQFFDRSMVRVQAVRAERTFWEKVTILHHEAHRPEGLPVPSGYSRHYYDVCRMSQAGVKQSALQDLDLLRQVVEFKQKFYHRGWARYDRATPGTMKLVPPEHVESALRRDYEEMRFMIYGDRPRFSDVMHAVQQLEEEINRLESEGREA